MLKDVLVIEGQPENWEEALSLTYSELLNHGYVKGIIPFSLYRERKAFTHRFTYGNWRRHTSHRC